MAGRPAYDFLANVDAEDAHIIEGMRHGLHRATDCSYFHAYRGKALPAVAPVR